MIEIIRDKIRCKIIGLTNSDVIEQIDRSLSYYITGYMFTPSYKSGRWDGRNRLLQKKGEEYYFLSGLLPRVEEILKSNHRDYKIIDKIKLPKLSKKIKTKNIEHRQYQQIAVKSAIENKSGIIKIPTGGGKTPVIAEIIAHFNVPTMVYVPGIDLLYQTKDALENFLHNTSIGVVGDGIVDIKKITVCTIWSCAKALNKSYEKFGDEDYTKSERFNKSDSARIKKAINDCVLLIVDECQFLGTSTLQCINKESKSAMYKFGLSATAFREDNADLLLEGAVGKTITNITATKLIEDGFLVQPEVHLINIPKIINSKNDYHSVYKNYIVENDVRNKKIIKFATKLVKSGRKLLILVKNIKHGEILLDVLQQDFVVYFVRGDLDSDQRNWIRDEFTRGGIDIIIASAVYDQGINIPSLDTLILAGGGKSVGKLFQRIGRVIRPYPGKKKAIILDFIDNAPHVLKHSAKRVETYRTEPGFKIKLPKKSEVLDGNSKKKKKVANKVQPKKWKGPMSW
jgi:superfamily II DNA or RNA helicase